MDRRLLIEVTKYFENIEKRSEVEGNLLVKLKNETQHFPVSSVHRDDLESEGFDVSSVTDEQMETIADKMGDAYNESGYWIDLKIFADNAGIPKHIDKDGLIREIKAIIDVYGAFSVADLEADASPSIYSGGGIFILTEFFAKDGVTATTYTEDGMEIYNEFKSYSGLNKDVLTGIYELCVKWEKENE